MSRIKVLAVTSQQPWPLNSGGHLRTFHLLNALSQECDVRLIFPVTERDHGDEALTQRAGFECCPIRVRGRSVSTEAVRWASAQLVREPYAMYRRHDRSEIRRAVAAESQAFQPDVIWLDHLDSFLYRSNETSTPVVLDLHNIYSLILDRLAEESSGLKRAALKLDSGRLRRIESAACERVDLVCSVSEQETSHFQGLGAKRVQLVPNGVDCHRIPFRDRLSDSAVPRILFLGAMDWTPNVSAAKFLATDLLPQLRNRFPDVELDLVGRNPAADVTSLSELAGVNVTGTVPDVAPYLDRAALFVVPLDSGGGTRLKILESFASGVPVVSTRVGVEGIDAIDGKHLRVLEREEMAQGIVEMLAQDDLNRLATDARQLVEERYDWKRIGDSATAALQSLISERR